MKIGDEKFLPDGTRIVTPQNTLLKITEMYAFVSEDETGEGLIADTRNVWPTYANAVCLRR